MGAIPVALQLYTVRDDAAADFEGTIRQVADMGYSGVELAGTYDRDAADLREIAQGLGLRIAGAHVPLTRLETELQSAIDFQLELGTRFMVCPWLPEDRRSSLDDYRHLAESFNSIGAACHENGIQFCYHNHDFELKRIDGQVGLDVLFDLTEPELVKAEIDTYWIEYAGANAVEYIRKYAGRAPLIHLKDMEGDGTRDFAEVGNGIMDWDSIFLATEAAKSKWHIVEQDKCRRPPLESARMSLEYLRSKGRA